MERTPSDLCVTLSFRLDRVHSAICICVDRGEGVRALSVLTGPIQYGMGPPVLCVERAKPHEARPGLLCVKWVRSEVKVPLYSVWSEPEPRPTLCGTGSGPICVDRAHSLWTGPFLYVLCPVCVVQAHSSTLCGAGPYLLPTLCGMGPEPLCLDQSPAHSFWIGPV